MNIKFKSDLVAGQKKEDELKQLLENNGYTVSSTQEKGKFSSYDLKVVTPSGKEKTIEVKYDIMSSRTGNVAVEMWKEPNGKKVKAGLLASKSTFYAYSFPSDDSFYFIKTSHLKQIINLQEYDRLVMGGDGGVYKIALFDKDKFISNCTPIS